MSNLKLVRGNPALSHPPGPARDHAAFVGALESEIDVCERCGERTRAPRDPRAARVLCRPCALAEDDA